jgi:hypothetical protein
MTKAAAQELGHLGIRVNSWTLPAVHDALAAEFADSSPDSPGFACTETMPLASETIGFD